MKIKKLQTTAFHPQSNGICERFHRTLINMILYFVSKEAQNWDKCLPYAVLAYRTTPIMVTGYSPHYLMYGQELRLPIEG
jgi:hypothetical protein